MIAKIGQMAAPLCLFAGYLAFFTSSHTIPGQVVPDDLAAQTRGGLCQLLKWASCPGNPNDPTNCPSGCAAQAGTVRGSGSGNINCSSSCGGYFNQLNNCPGS